MGSPYAASSWSWCAVPGKKRWRSGREVGGEGGGGGKDACVRYCGSHLVNLDEEKKRNKERENKSESKRERERAGGERERERNLNPPQ